MTNFPKISQSTEVIFLNLYEKQLRNQKFSIKEIDSDIATDIKKHRLIEKVNDSDDFILTSFGLEFAKVLKNKNFRSNVLKKMTLEDYLLAIYYVPRSNSTNNEDTNVVPMTDIARYLGLSNSSISEYIRIIEKEGFIKVIPRKGVTLTKSGEERVIQLIAKRETLVEFFNKILKFDSDFAEVESHVLEHNVRPIVIERLNLLIEQLGKMNFNLELKE